MNPALDESLLADLSRLVVERIGVCFPPSRWNDLERAFCRAAADLGFQNQKECVTWFMATPASRQLIESISVYLTTGETYFFREGRSFDILEHEIVPGFIHSRAGSEKRLRLWSAGCATGEEPYTLAIMLHRMGLSLRDWNISILATDINPQALRKAAEGVYTKWSFRDTPDWFRGKYFLRKGDHHFELIPAIKKMVKFAYLNLVEGPAPSLLTDTNAMDVIFCRNVLMYFPPERAERAVERFRHCLVDGGWLTVSACEVSNPLFSGFKPINFPGITLYRRQADSKSGATKDEKPTPSLPLSTPLPMQALSSPPPLPTPPVRTTSPSQTPHHLYEEALALYKQGDGRKATEHVTAQLSLHPNDTRALALLCRIRANEGRLEEALQWSEQALRADKLDPGLHYLRAMILQEQGAVDEAEAALKRALYLDHDLVLAHFTLANIALRRGKCRESRKHFGHALTILARYQPEDLLPESEGMPAGRLTSIIKTWLPACNEEMNHEHKPIA